MNLIEHCQRAPSEGKQEGSSLRTPFPPLHPGATLLRESPEEALPLLSFALTKERWVHVLVRRFTSCEPSVSEAFAVGS